MVILRFLMLRVTLICILFNIFYNFTIGDCYLGVSLYSDGICREIVGKINPSKGLIHMSQDQEAFICPFFLYLTVTMESENEILISENFDTNPDNTGHL